MGEIIMGVGQFIFEVIAGLLARFVYGTESSPRPRWRRMAFLATYFGSAALLCGAAVNPSPNEGAIIAATFGLALILATVLVGERQNASVPVIIAAIACWPLPLILLAM